MNSPLLLLAGKIDLNIIDFITTSVTPFGVKISLFLSNLGSPQSFLLLLIASAMIFWLFKKPYSLIQFFVTLGAGMLSVYSLKILILDQGQLGRFLILVDIHFQVDTQQLQQSSLL